MNVLQEDTTNIGLPQEKFDSKKTRFFGKSTRMKAFISANWNLIIAIVGFLSILTIMVGLLIALSGWMWRVPSEFRIASQCTLLSAVDCGASTSTFHDRSSDYMDFHNPFMETLSNSAARMYCKFQVRVVNETNIRTSIDKLLFDSSSNQIKMLYSNNPINSTVNCFLSIEDETHVSFQPTTSGAKISLRVIGFLLIIMGMGTMTFCILAITAIRKPCLDYLGSVSRRLSLSRKSVKQARIMDDTVPLRGGYRTSVKSNADDREYFDYVEKGERSKVLRGEEEGDEDEVIVV